MRSYLKKALNESVNGLVSFNRRLRDYTTFRIGGMPRVWVEPDTLEDLRRALAVFSKKKIRPFLIGNGSNVLVRDGRLNRAVIRLSSPRFKRLEFRGNLVIAGSGQGLAGFIKRCIEKGLSGLEGFAGIPGTVGGAVTVNAGAGGKSIGDFIEWVKVLDYKGKKVSLVKKDKLKFKYRDSGLSEYIILEVQLKLKKRPPEIISRNFSAVLQKKLATQDYRWPNAGCIFRNPPDSILTSGEILDRCNLKGLRVRGAEVSARHANFIINKGGARFRDIISLIELERRIVRKRFGIWLKPEVRIIR